MRPERSSTERSRDCVCAKFQKIKFMASSQQLDVHFRPEDTVTVNQAPWRRLIETQETHTDTYMQTHTDTDTESI